MLETAIHAAAVVVAAVELLYASNTDSHISLNVCSSAVTAECILSHQSMADNIATLKYE